MKKPKLHIRIKNFLKALIDHIKTGLRKSSKREQNKRMRICNNCEYQNEKKECTICGCYLPMKTAWKEQKCPENKW